MAFFGPLKLSESTAPSTNALPGQPGYTAYPNSNDQMRFPQQGGQAYLDMIIQELGKRFPGMSQTTSYAGGEGGGTNALGFTYNGPGQGAGTLEGVGAVSPESLTALLSGVGAPQTIEGLISRVPGQQASRAAGQASAPSVSQPGQSSLGAPNQAPVTLGSGVDEGNFGMQGGIPSDTPMAEAQPGEANFGGQQSNTPDGYGYGALGGLTAMGGGIIGGVAGGLMGMGGGLPGMAIGGTLGALSGSRTADAARFGQEAFLADTLGRSRGSAMDDPSANAPEGTISAPEGVFGGVAASGPASGEVGTAPGGTTGVGSDTPGGQAGAETGGGPGAGGAPGGGNAAGDTGGQAGEESGGGGGGAGGGGGSSVICTHLFHNGYMSQAIFDADTAFGKQLDPQVYRGYMTWAPTVVNMMKTHPRLTPLVAAIATPWATHMAYRMGASAKDSMVGSWIMKLGTIGCRKLGRVQISQSVPTV